jgi:dTDP-4-dehydrorhamnose reductase
MRLLLFGGTGQVGRSLLALRDAGLEVVAVGRDQADLNDAHACAAVVRSAGADVVVNVAAYTDVDRAERDEAEATRVNALAPGAMAREAMRLDTPFIHLSTDFVFDGSGPVPIRECARPAPLNAYGRSKLGGERAVLAAGGRCAILRTSRVHSLHGRSFVRRILDAGGAQGSLAVVDDRISGPTPAPALAAAIMVVARALGAGRGPPGLFHFSGRPAVDLCSFARAIVDAASRPTIEIRPIRSSELGTGARRPGNTTLDCSKIARAYGLGQPDWRSALREMLS